MTDKQNLQSVLNAFYAGLEITEAEVLPGGLIHGSWKVTTEIGERYVVQKMNTGVFADPGAVMANIVQVTGHLKKKGQPTLEFLSLGGKAERYVHQDSEDQIWRLSRWVENSKPAGPLTTLDEVEAAGRMYGRFARHLKDFPAEKLTKVIPGFHDTSTRWAALLQAVHEDPMGRAEEVEEDLVWLHERGDLAMGLLRLETPVRVVHNDAKWANLLLDETTNQPCCVVDLDTVMPGTLLHDFGDMVRTMCCTADEEETELSMVEIDVARVEALADGWLGEIGTELEEVEILNLLPGALVIVFEQAVRFLTDYLMGDVYYSVSRPDHNLNRARHQLALLASMLDQLPELAEVLP